MVLFAVLVLLVAAHRAMPSDPTRRNLHFMPEMVDSPAYEAQAPAPALPGGGRVDLRPPEGSVARGYPPFPYRATEQDAQRAGVELTNPEAAGDPAVLARGAAVFANFCATCHGASGTGDGPVTRRGVPPPPSLLSDHARAMADGYLYHIISVGRRNMAGYAAQIERHDRWKVVSHVRSLQQATVAR